MPHRILKVSEHGMLDAYGATLKARGFKSDPAQRAAAQRLQGLYSELVAFKATRNGHPAQAAVPVPATAQPDSAQRLR